MSANFPCHCCLSAAADLRPAACTRDLRQPAAPSRPKGASERELNSTCRVSAVRRQQSAAIRGSFFEGPFSSCVQNRVNALADQSKLLSDWSGKPVTSRADRHLLTNRTVTSHCSSLARHRACSAKTQVSRCIWPRASRSALVIAMPRASGCRRHSCCACSCAVRTANSGSTQSWTAVTRLGGARTSGPFGAVRHSIKLSDRGAA
jgi:hypothetical protein